VIAAAPGSRYWPDLDPSPLFREGLLSVDRELRIRIDSLHNTSRLPTASLLAISGGGDNGAFAAGLLVGWTASKTRPTFKMVTGISAGALIAPFAFLGSDYDNVLQQVSRSVEPRDIFHVRNFIEALLGDGFADATPLAHLIAKYVTRDVLSAVAREYSTGRLLFIGTTNLDSGQRVIWNMGAIAASADPHALQLFRRVILASAAIPGVFSPVMIDVAVDGRRYQEMHVDGGVMNQAFLVPPRFIEEIDSYRPDDHRKRDIYVIRNGYLSGEWESVARHTTTVALRALDMLIDVQGISDLYRVEVAAGQEHAQFHFAFIGHDFNYPHRRAFAPDYVRHLYQYAFDLVTNGDPWRQRLPDRTWSTSAPSHAADR